jgi:hypothetical protein
MQPSIYAAIAKWIASFAADQAELTSSTRSVDGTETLSISPTSTGAATSIYIEIAPDECRISAGRYLELSHLPSSASLILQFVIALAEGKLTEIDHVTGLRETKWKSMLEMDGRSIERSGVRELTESFLTTIHPILQGRKTARIITPYVSYLEQTQLYGRDERVHVIPPYVVAENGMHVSFYRSINNVQSNVEADDIKSSEYQMFDSEGRSLRGVPSAGARGWIDVVALDTEPVHQTFLHRLVSDVLRDAGYAPEWVAMATLGQLCAAGLQWATSFRGN